MSTDNINTEEPFSNMYGPHMEPVITTQIISLQDISNSIEVLQAEEQKYNIQFNAISNLSYQSLRTNLIQWAVQGYPNCYTIYEVPIILPELCSDGIHRNLENFITYCAGKTLVELVSELQSKMKDIQVGFSFTGASIVIHVSKVE